MINLTAAAITDPGLNRDMNEDRVWAEAYNPSEGDAVGLFVVCDGMGGHRVKGGMDGMGLGNVQEGVALYGTLGEAVHQYI